MNAQSGVLNNVFLLSTFIYQILLNLHCIISSALALFQPHALLWRQHAFDAGEATDVNIDSHQVGILAFF